MRIVTASLISVLLVVLASSAFPRTGNMVELRIMPVRGGKFLTIPFKEFREGRTSVIKKYLEARRGENYVIEIKNNTADRIGVVIAVDGRNIISGRTSHLRNNENMYVVNPHDSVSLEGWRTDLRNVNRFYFTQEADSYAVRTFGDSSAMGVIAAAVYREKNRPRKYYRQESKKYSFDAPAAPSEKNAANSLRSESAGTGFGEHAYSPAVRVDFKPERTPFEKILVKYEWPEVLCSKGIRNCEEKKNRLWDDYGFVPYPPGYVSR